MLTSLGPLSTQALNTIIESPDSYEKAFARSSKKYIRERGKALAGLPISEASAVTWKLPFRKKW